MKGKTPKVTRKSSEKKTLKRKSEIIGNDEIKKVKMTEKLWILLDSNYKRDILILLIFCTEIW